jgi:enoyl-CoA hydratase/carnithine racemase
MIKSMRPSTLQTLGLGTVLEIFENGRLPVVADDLVEEIFGSSGDRGSLVISGINGIVGAGKAMQLSSRLGPLGVPIVGLDLPDTPDNFGNHYKGLLKAFGKIDANKVLSNIIRLTYDGVHLPYEIEDLNPRVLLEAIPENLDLKKKHYALFQQSFPKIEIRSVTSGFPSSELGVAIAHPAFPHEINKVWEIVESKPSAFTKLLWALGLVPVPVEDHWSFILDVLFCGITLAGLRYHQASNMPYWKIDKYIRKYIGPNPYRAHDVIGAKGANFLTWSCLHDLQKQYGDLFQPTPDLEERKDSGQTWYPPDHFRPIVDWTLEEGDENFLDWIQGSIFQMTSMLIHENRGHYSHINAMGELCAQFRQGILATIRRMGAEKVIQRVKNYHSLHPVAAKSAWHPAVFDDIKSTEWQQLYVNAEHNDEIGIITISRESYNSDVDDELNQALDWLKSENISKLIVTGDFHLSTQMIGADTSEFFPALNNSDEGYRISRTWSKTARRLHDEFHTSVGYIHGKRCLGGFLELLLHCHYLVSLDKAVLGMPEVTLPVIPGMEGCHWPFRKADSEDWPKLVHLLLSGESVPASQAVGWLVDYAGPREKTLKIVWQIVSRKDHGLRRKDINEDALEVIPHEIDLPASENKMQLTARKSVIDTIQHSCSVPLLEALDIQAKHSAEFMTSDSCRSGKIGSEYSKIMID